MWGAIASAVIIGPALVGAADYIIRDNILFKKYQKSGVQESWEEYRKTHPDDIYKIRIGSKSIPDPFVYPLVKAVEQIEKKLFNANSF